MKSFDYREQNRQVDGKFGYGRNPTDDATAADRAGMLDDDGDPTSDHPSMANPHRDAYRKVVAKEQMHGYGALTHDDSATIKAFMDGKHTEDEAGQIANLFPSEQEEWYDEMDSGRRSTAPIPEASTVAYSDDAPDHFRAEFDRLANVLRPYGIEVDGLAHISPDAPRELVALHSKMSSTGYGMGYFSTGEPGADDGDRLTSAEQAVRDVLDGQDWADGSAIMLNSGDLKEQFELLKAGHDQGMLSDEESDLMDQLEAMRDTRVDGFGGDVTFINDSYFEEHARGYAESTGAIDPDSWVASHVDWAEAARGLKSDYQPATFQGSVFWSR